MGWLDSFKGVSGISSYALKNAQSSDTNNAVNTTKVEGTTQTYGQWFSFPKPKTDDGKKTTTSTAKAGGLSSFLGDFSSATSSPESSKSSFLNEYKKLTTNSSTPPFGTSNQSLTSNNKTIKVPYFTTVKIYQRTDQLEDAINSFGSISNLPCKIKSNAAIAAASSNNNAAIIVSNNSLISQSPSKKNYFGYILGNFSKVIPNVEEHILVPGSTIKSKEEVKRALTEAQKVDLTISLKSKTSESIEFNGLKTPGLDATLRYNFFTEDEEDILTQEDPDRDPLLTNKPISVPRYVELNWGNIEVTEQQNLKFEVQSQVE